MCGSAALEDCVPELCDMSSDAQYCSMKHPKTVDADEEVDHCNACAFQRNAA